jgi:hypothetical protein
MAVVPYTTVGDGHQSQRKLRIAAWEDTFLDALCEPPETFTFGGTFAHVITFNFYRRMVNQQLLLQNEYLAAENKILRTHLPTRLGLTDPQRSTLAEIGKRLGRRALQRWHAQPSRTPSWLGIGSSSLRSSTARSTVDIPGREPR